MIARVTELTGLDPEFVKFSGGRLETGAYLREAHREEGKLGSIYDSNVTSFDPFPFAPEQRAAGDGMVGSSGPLACGLALATTALFAQDAAADDKAAAAELAKKLSNPVAALISVPFQHNFDFGAGPNGDPAPKLRWFDDELDELAKAGIRAEITGRMALREGPMLSRSREARNLCYGDGTGPGPRRPPRPPRPRADALRRGR